jgi:hypothetical protein
VSNAKNVEIEVSVMSGVKTWHRIAKLCFDFTFVLALSRVLGVSLNFSKLLS